MREIGHFVGGKHVAGTSGRMADVLMPMDGTVQGRVALASAEEVRAAVENAKAAQPGWAATNPQRRARVLMRFLDAGPERNMIRSPNCLPASTARPSPTPRATSSAGSKSSNSASARRIF